MAQRINVYHQHAFQNTKTRIRLAAALNDGFGILPPLAAYRGKQFYVLAFTEDILDPAIGNEPHHRD
jgi:hypothetical protein